MQDFSKKLGSASFQDAVLTLAETVEPRKLQKGSNWFLLC
jgi:hypothetical protein